MKMTLSTSHIASALREDSNANWSGAGAWALAEYLEEYEESTGEELELDVVAIRCDFSEFASLEAWAEEYFSDYNQAADALGLTVDMSGEEFEEDEDEVESAIRSYIEENGQLIEFSGGIIVSSF